MFPTPADVAVGSLFTICSHRNSLCIVLSEAFAVNKFTMSSERGAKVILVQRIQMKFDLSESSAVTI